LFHMCFVRYAADNIPQRDARLIISCVSSRSACQLERADASSSCITCVALHLPPRAAGIPRSSSAAARARSDVAPACAEAARRAGRTMDKRPVRLLLGAQAGSRATRFGVAGR
jgi:hypothetical protein